MIEETKRPRRASRTQCGGHDALRYRRIVAKFGTNLLTAGTDRLDLQVMSRLVGQVARIHGLGGQIVVVTSGAIAAGRHRLAAGAAGSDVAVRQVLASVGQSHLMRSYDDLFGWHDLTVAQALLTRRDLADRTGYLNARSTLLALLDLGVVPIVNENDVVATDEIENGFGDNDYLSALVTNLIDADLLALLSDVEGLYTADPRKDPEAQLVRHVEQIDDRIEAMAGEAGLRGTGGMAAKLRAAKLATTSGADVAVAAGHEPDVLVRLAAGEQLGTLFPAQSDRLESRRRWMLSAVGVRGRVVIDDGAAEALLRRGSSLLPAGVREVSGRFERGDTVSIETGDRRRLAVGIANYGAADLARLRGERSDRIVEILGYQYGAEAVHRNNLVLL